MAKTQIKPKYFTDEEGEWKALIGKNIFCFSYNNDRKLVGSVSLNSGTTVRLYDNSVWSFYHCSLYICHSRAHSGSLMFNAMFFQLLNIFMNGFICRNN